MLKLTSQSKLRAYQLAIRHQVPSHLSLSLFSIPSRPRAESGPYKPRIPIFVAHRQNRHLSGHLATLINLSHHLLCFSGGSSLARVRKCSSAQTFLIRPLRYVSSFDIASSSSKLQVNLSESSTPSNQGRRSHAPGFPGPFNGSHARLYARPVIWQEFGPDFRVGFPNLGSSEKGNPESRSDFWKLCPILKGKDREG